MSHSILRLQAVIARTGLARATIYKQMREGEFPRHISLGVKSVGWLASDIQNWIEERIQVSCTNHTGGAK